MNLLTFAHRGEAQHFLKADKYQSVKFSFNGLFRNKENYLLITGEGFESAEERMTIFLSQQNITIHQVVNLGIAGALDAKLELESVHLINQIFKEDDNKTFQSDNINSNMNCISALARVHDMTYKTKLAQKAQIVDRELWAIANACHSFNMPITSIKLISDYADSITDSKEIIKKSKMYSEKLYNYYKNYFDL